MVEKDVFFMKQALAEARLARDRGEVPVGAVVVRDGDIIGRGYNSVIGKSDSSAHAEVVALRKAGKKIRNYRLSDSEIYVTLEPCLMCFSALVHARVRRLVYAARDPKTGIFSTGAFERINDIYNHSIQVESGILHQQVSNMLKAFFQERRDAGAVERDGLENR
ncbi:MAG: tRNA adenosine(34) deaminase TadA [Candidatus Aminicenantes bacterium]|nr:tRNA adenosine(34) deaminase TadA [Candidatus Aminicenantes bacterium]